jgi:hypothetical protein
VKPTRLPGGKKQTSFKNKVTFACCMNVKHKKSLINFVIYKSNPFKKCKIENNDYEYLITQDLSTIDRKLYKNTSYIEIFFCLFCNCRGSKATRMRTQNTGKTKKLPYFQIGKVQGTFVITATFKEVNYNGLPVTFCFLYRARHVTIAW